MNKHIKQFLLLIMVILLTSCALNQTNKENNDDDLSKQYNLLVSTDFHYQYDDLEKQTSIMKQMLYNHEIIDAFFDEVKQKNPDALLLCGDNTNNGSEVAHTTLINELTVIRNQGIKVVMAFGSHDLIKYGKDDIKKMYGDLIFNDAVSVDETTLSYIYPISSELWVLIVDPDIEVDELNVSDETSNWISTNLNFAKANNIQIIAMSHYGLITDGENKSQVSIIENNKELIKSFNKYNVSLYLSGHRHKQELRKNESLTNTIYELISNTLIDYPNIYGEININRNKELSYTARYLDVSTYAKENGLTDINLLNFSDFSENSFIERIKESVEMTLNEFDLTKDQKNEMLNFAVRVFYAYTTNTIYQQQEAFKNEPEYFLWKSQKETAYGKYLMHLITTTIYNGQEFSFSLKN